MPCFNSLNEPLSNNFTNLNRQHIVFLLQKVYINLNQCFLKWIIFMSIQGLKDLLIRRNKWFVFPSNKCTFMSIIYLERLRRTREVYYWEMFFITSTVFVRNKTHFPPKFGRKIRVCLIVWMYLTWLAGDGELQCSQVTGGGSRRTLQALGWEEGVSRWWKQGREDRSPPCGIL